MTLKELQVGRSARVLSVGGGGALRQHFLDMGVIPGAEVMLVKLAPMGDPMELRLHGYELTLRLDDAAQIEVEPIAASREEERADDLRRDAKHPGFGQSGIFHTKSDGFPLPETEKLTFALAGNQN